MQITNHSWGEKYSASIITNAWKDFQIDKGDKKMSSTNVGNLFLQLCICYSSFSFIFSSGREQISGGENKCNLKKS